MKNLKNKRTNHINGRKSKVILLFLGISFVFWVLIKLSKEYTDVISLKVDYINVPEGKMLQGNVKDYVDVTIRAYGFDLVKYHLFKREIQVDLKSLKRKKKSVYYQLAADLLPQVEKQIAADIEVFNIQPDTIYYRLSVSKTKEVNIVADLDIIYQLGYNLMDSLIITPDHITISGPANLIDSIKYVSTQKKELNDVNDDIHLKIPLIELKKEARVKYSVNKVDISGKVEKFTEAKLQLPFIVKNLPSNYTINVFPDEVEVIFNVGLSDYSKINKNDFKVECDYQLAVKNGLNYLVPEVVSKPAIVNEVKIVPDKIEYLITK